MAQQDVSSLVFPAQPRRYKILRLIRHEHFVSKDNLFISIIITGLSIICTFFVLQSVLSWTF